ncbi:putative ubiquitin carboxyl-terminal hydrolase [Neospora caninum Liverpool]|uniref:Putative ubiquitin carboxyl-terminal hydrolase n=1 Tax=Neospora caninum (strain Liverpool) TaxID=572307 RepID=F0V8J7_NEOCL|nr:putative ubiquitin carboxyl-terminal hydrolase [Neospora caninum Liverpool]CBZ50038.1 putative ubiquitin carboxyl-terminal hydrolase [Neospora caninum Liverpool]CEL64628.1 TPA: ubiquitin carboxyl-terminal hydrolase, putative [Neospora caninum Liverpool]|eukprot:XP_003880073.1 putative ubiquitin carboxyl-terminal hydrolase [Neospora caninum Liverpool]
MEAASPATEPFGEQDSQYEERWTADSQPRPTYSRSPLQQTDNERFASSSSHGRNSRPDAAPVPRSPSHPRHAAVKRDQLQHSQSCRGQQSSGPSAPSQSSSSSSRSLPRASGRGEPVTLNGHAGPPTQIMQASFGSLRACRTSASSASRDEALPRRSSELAHVVQQDGPQNWGQSPSWPSSSLRAEPRPGQKGCSWHASEAEVAHQAQAWDSYKGEKRHSGRNGASCVVASDNSALVRREKGTREGEQSPVGGGSTFTWAQRVSGASHDPHKPAKHAPNPWVVRSDEGEQGMQKERQAPTRAGTGEGEANRTVEIGTEQEEPTTRPNKETFTENDQEATEIRAASSRLAGPSAHSSSMPVSPVPVPLPGWSRGPSAAVFAPPSQGGGDGRASRRSAPKTAASAVAPSGRERGPSRDERKAQEWSVGAPQSGEMGGLPMHAANGEHDSSRASPSEKDRAQLVQQIAGGKSQPLAPAGVAAGYAGAQATRQDENRQEREKHREKEEAGPGTDGEKRENGEEDDQMRPPYPPCLLSAIMDRVRVPEGERIARTHEDATELPDLTLKLDAADFPSFVQRGLVNTHNNCYMNAVIQALVPVLLPLWPRLLSPLWARKNGNGVVSLSRASSPSLWSSLADAAQVFLDPQRPSSSLARPGDVARIFQHVVSGPSRGGMSGGLVWGQQADASEFLLFLINGLHDECKWTRGPSAGFAESSAAQNGDDGFVEVGKKNKKIKPRVVGSEEDSLVYRLFGGLLRECSVDPRTGSKLSERKEFFLFLSCSVLPHLRTLESVLETHFADRDVEPAEDKASAADDRSLAKGRGKGVSGEGRKRGPETERRPRCRLQTRIESPPPILVIVLQRFCYDRQKQRAMKVSHPVALSEQLVLRSSWCVCPCGGQRNQHVGGKRDKIRGTGCSTSYEEDVAMHEREEQSHLSLEERTYDLAGVISHKGVLMNRGHYTAASRLPAALAASVTKRKGGCREPRKVNVLAGVKGGRWAAAATLTGDEMKRETETEGERNREEVSESESEKERHQAAEEKLQETSWILSDDMSCSVRPFDAVQNMEGHYVLIFVNRRWQVSTDPARSFEQARRFQSELESGTERWEE